MENIAKENFNIWDWIMSLSSLFITVMFMYVGFLFNVPFIIGFFLFPPTAYILYTKIKKLSPINYKKYITMILLILLLLSIIHIYFLDNVMKMFNTYGS